MKTPNLFFALLAFCVNFAHADYAPGDDYTLARGPSPWSTAFPEQSGFEYRLLYLLQADKEAKDIWYSQPKGLSYKQGRALARAVDSLDIVLIGAYVDATKLLQSHPNARLLKMLLAHYCLYINSANESWPDVFANLAKIDKALAREVAKEVKPRWKNPSNAVQP
jgi:hypothetical protein